MAVRLWRRWMCSAFGSINVKTRVRPSVLSCALACALVGGWILLQPRGQRCPLRLSIQHGSRDSAGHCQALLEISNASPEDLIFEFSLETKVRGGWVRTTPQSVFADYSTLSPAHSSQTITNALPPTSAQVRFNVGYYSTNLTFTESLAFRAAGQCSRWRALRGIDFMRLAHEFRMRRLRSPVLTMESSEAEK